MKRAAIVPLGILSGLALLGAGYWLGRSAPDARLSSDDGGSADRTSAAVLGAPPVTAESLAEKTASAGVRPFVPGRPFARGQAAAWLRGLAAEDDFENFGDVVRAFQNLATLDLDAARELAVTVLAIAKRLEDDDADEEALWPGDEDVLKAAIYGSLFIIAQQDPEGALALIAGMENLDDELLEAVWPEIARGAPARVEEMLAALPPEQIPEALENALEGFAAADLGIAAGILDKYSGPEFDGHRRDLIERWVGTDPRVALDVAAGFIEAGHGPGALREGFDRWFGDDAEGARRWAEGYAGPGREAVLACVLRRDAASDPHAAIETLDVLRGQGADAESLGGVPSTIVGALFKQGDPATAIQWVERLSDEGLRLEGISTLADQWTDSDAPAASEWIATLATGAARDAAVEQLVDAIDRRDPGSALEWARSISEAGTRNRLVADVMETWKAQDPDAAAAAASALRESGDLPED